MYWKWFLTSICGRPNAVLLYPFGLFRKSLPKSKWNLTSCFYFKWTSGSKCCRFNGKYIQRCMSSTEVCIACDFIWLPRMEVKAWCYCYVCRLDECHVCSCTAAGISYSDVQTNTTMTFTSIYFSDRNVRQWQLRVASSQQNVADIEVYCTVYAHMSFHGSYLWWSTRTGWC